MYFWFLSSVGSHDSKCFSVNKLLKRLVFLFLFRQTGKTGHPENYCHGSRADRILPLYYGFRNLLAGPSSFLLAKK
jgi:hypothetical protein